VDAKTGVFMLFYPDLAYEQACRTGRLASLDKLRDAVLTGAVKRIRPIERARQDRRADQPRA
jgi:Cu(I)/Ag(I) efflux system membrane protein CusA/SilA